MADHSQAGYGLAVLLALAFRTMVDELHRQLAVREFDDVRPAHGFAFVRLAPDGATGNELAEHLGVSKQAASQMVDYLEEHGYVTRRPHPRDGRGKLVVLTERGWACIEAVEAIFADLERRSAEVVGAERMELLRADLHRLVFALGDGASPRRLRPVW
jgi:DNA-binding MarR family transcriptional regulator